MESYTLEARFKRMSVNDENGEDQKAKVLTTDSTHSSIPVELILEIDQRNYGIAVT